jgi:hypothetical protein
MTAGAKAAEVPLFIPKVKDLFLAWQINTAGIYARTPCHRRLCEAPLRRQGQF